MPAPLQRIRADDLLALVFPDQQACLENIVGEREIPDHPLVQAMLESLGEPIMSSTLSLPGDDTPLTEPLDIEAKIGHEVDVIVDAGATGIEPPGRAPRDL